MKTIQFLIVASLLSFTVAAQDKRPPFYEDIQQFKRQDSLAFPPKNATLFVGSSSFTMWKDVQSYFPDQVIINRGFGGSTLRDVYYYALDIIYPYEPKQIVMYCGENDFAANDSLQPRDVAKRFAALFELIRTRYKLVPFYYISMKPSPARAHLMKKYEAANEMIKAFLKRHRKTDFIDVYHAMLNKDGTPREELFLEDRLHMNKKGYDIWQKIIGPYLKD